MTRAVTQNSEFRWTVALEAALFFSIPSWMHVADPAWPSEDPIQFAAAVLAGAFAALLLCHVLPAACASTLTALSETPIGRIARWPVDVWMCVGAAAALLQFARASSSFYVGHRQHEPALGWVAAFLAVVCILVPMALAWRPTRWQQSVIALCLGFGVCFAVASLAAQWTGMGIRMTRWVYGGTMLDLALGVAKGILLAAAPASILAFRLGRIGLSTKQIWHAGSLGVWLPVVASAVIVSLAKMCGARLYWEPSLPIDVVYVITWLYQSRDLGAASLWLVGPLWLATSLVCAIWIKDLTPFGDDRWRQLIVLTLAGAVAFGLTLETLAATIWIRFYDAWLWSIPIGSLLLAAAHLLRRQRLSP